MATIPTTSTFLAEVVNRLHPGFTTASTLADYNPNLQPGNLVLVKDDNTTQLQWPIAVIIDTHPGKDHSVRLVTLQTPKGIFKRPITKICPLPRVMD